MTRSVGALATTSEPARPVKRRRNPDDARKNILAAAQGVLVNNDGRLEMSQVARAAGVSAGLAYHHFGSKEGLLAAVVNAFYDRVDQDILLARIEGYADWEERERARTELYINFLLSDPLGPLLVTSLAQTPEVAAIDAARWTSLVQVGARNIAEGQRLGMVRADESPSLLAAMVLGGVRSAVVHAIQEHRDALQRLTAERLTEEIWAFQKRALALPC
ncbi:MAG: TetR/AcrR family transcriptional regulator [Pseudomonadota bacterium]